MDREMLEMAARAAGYEVEFDHEGIAHVHEGTGPQSWAVWNPLTDDGDALRLAVKLCMSVLIGEGGTVSACVDYNGREIKAVENYYPNGLAATRLAIVRAAAEIGRAMG